MSIYNDCKIIINLNQLVKDRPSGRDLAEEHVDNIANDLRKRMTFDSLFGQVDHAIWDYAEECNIDLSDDEECQEFGFQIPQYGQIETGVIPEPEFEIAKLSSMSGSWEIDVPRRINKKKRDK